MEIKVSACLVLRTYSTGNSNWSKHRFNEVYSVVTVIGIQIIGVVRIGQNIRPVQLKMAAYGDGYKDENSRRTLH
jgi:hypothetical protein